MSLLERLGARSGGDHPALEAMRSVNGSLTNRVRRERKLLHALQNSVEGIAYISLEQNYVEVFPVYAKILGFEDPEELVGGDWRKTIERGSEERFRHAYDEMRETGRSRVAGLRKRKDGNSMISMSVLQADVSEEGKFLGHWCFMHDAGTIRNFCEEIVGSCPISGKHGVKQ